MLRKAAPPQADTFTFRLDPALKLALAQSAAEEHKQPAELLRELVRDYLARKQRQAFELEARRQCAELNARAGDSDEARIMGEFDAGLEGLAAEWR